MRSLTLLALISIATAIPIPQSDSGFDNGVLVEPPNNQPIAPSQPAVNNPVGGGNDGGFTGNGQPVNDVSNNSPITNTPLPPVDPANGGGDGGFVDGAPVDPTAPASGSSSIFGIGIGIAKKAAIPNSATTATGGSGVAITTDNILAVSADAGSCEGAKFPDECRTAEQAAPLVSDSFSKFGINNKAEAAAVMSLMMFESGNFQFNIHHFPGPNPGQGTRNMMNFPFILEYAKDVLPESEKAGLPASADGVDDAKKEEILAKVLGDEFSFGSGAWFYSKKCDAETKSAVQSGSEEGWKQYITKCVGGSLDQREEGWNKAKQALGA